MIAVALSAPTLPLLIMPPVTPVTDSFEAIMTGTVLETPVPADDAIVATDNAVRPPFQNRNKDNGGSDRWDAMAHTKIADEQPAPTMPSSPMPSGPTPQGPSDPLKANPRIDQPALTGQPSPTPQAAPPAPPPSPPSPPSHNSGGLKKASPAMSSIACTDAARIPTGNVAAVPAPSNAEPDLSIEWSSQRDDSSAPVPDHAHKVIFAAVQPAPVSPVPIVTRVDPPLPLPELNLIDDPVWIDLLARDIAASTASDGTLNFRLLPERLGHLDIALTHHDGALDIIMQTSTDTATGMIVAEQPRLIEELRQAGMKVGNLEMTTGQHNSAPRQHQSAPHQPVPAAPIPTQSKPRPSKRNDRFA